MAHPQIPTISRGGSASAWRLHRPGAAVGYPGAFRSSGVVDGSAPTPVPYEPQQLAAQTGQMPVPSTPFDPRMSRRANYQQDLRERRTSSSPLFQESVRRNNDLKAAQAQRQAAFVANKQAGIAAMQQQNMAGGAAADLSAGSQLAAPGTPKDSVTLHRDAAMQAYGQPVSPATKGLKINPDGSSTTTLRFAGTPDVPGEDAGDYVQSELQRERNVTAQQNRGLGLAVQDGGAFQLRPIRQSQLGAPPGEAVTRTFQQPKGGYGLNQAQLEQVNRAADQQAYAIGQTATADAINYPRRLAELQAGGGFEGQAKSQVAASEADMNRARGQMYLDQGQAAVKRAEAPGAPRPVGKSTATTANPVTAGGPTYDDYRKLYETALANNDADTADYARRQMGGIDSRRDTALQEPVPTPAPLPGEQPPNGGAQDPRPSTRPTPAASGTPKYKDGEKRQVDGKWYQRRSGQWHQM